MNPAGLLGNWLLRGLKAGASSSPDGATLTPEPETPTWSEASEASGSDTQPESEDPASSHGRSRATGTQADKGPGLTSRFGGWLSGVCFPWLWFPEACTRVRPVYAEAMPAWSAMHTALLLHMICHGSLERLCQGSPPQLWVYKATKLPTS